MTLLYGLWFGLGVGVSDYHGGYLAKRSHAVSTVASAMLAGAIVMALLLVVIDSALVGSDLLLGAGSGSLIGFALASLYHGMAVSSAAVVTPIAATLAAVIPFGWDLSTGGSLPGLALVGAAVAFVGLVLSTVSPELGDRVRVGLVWGVVAGVCFGASLTFLGATSEDSGLLPAVAQRLTGLTTLLATATFQRLPRFVERGLWPRAVVSGLFGATGIAAFTVGSQRGSLAEVAAVSAIAPAVTAVMSATFDGHAMRWWQALGGLVCAAGVAVIAIA